MAESISYQLGIDTADYTRGMEQAAAMVRELGQEQQRAARVTGFGGMLDGTRAREAAAGVTTLKESLSEVTSETRSLEQAAGSLAPKMDQMLNIGRAQVAQELARSLGQIGGKIRETATKFAEADREMSANLTNVADGLDATAAAVNGAAMGFAVAGPVGAAFGAVVAGGLNLVTAAFDDMTTAQAGAAASEAAWIQQIQNLSNLRQQLATEEAEAAAKAAAADLESQQAMVRATEEAMVARERLARDAAATRERIAAQSAAREAAAQEQVYADRLSPEANLNRQIAELQNRVAPPSAERVNSLPENSPQRAQAAEDLARLVSLQQDLAELQARGREQQDAATAKAQREADAARDRAAAEERIRTSREAAATAFERENAILAARAAGNETLVAQLQRQQTLADLTARIMREQGTSETAAAVQAERRLSLQEAAAGRGERSPIYRLSAEESAARRQSREDAVAKARQDRWDNIGIARDAGDKAFGRGPDKKDHTETIATKLDRLQSIDEKLENLASA